MSRAIFFFSCLVLFVCVYEISSDVNFLQSITYEEENKSPLCCNSEIERETVQKILTQTFRYYSEGNQCYVYESADGEYVLKFFKLGRLKPSRWLEYFSVIPFVDSYRIRMRKGQSNRLKKVYAGHTIAYEQDKENCGIIAVRFPGSGLNVETIKLIDRWGLKREVQADRVVFVLQKKAETTRKLLRRYLAEGNLSSAEQLIDRIFALYLDEYSKGIYDRDHNVIDNIGFIAGNSMRIDVGKLRRDPEFVSSDKYLPDLEEKVIKRLDTWIKRDYGPLYPHFSRYLQLKVKALYNESSQSHRQ